MSHLNHTDTVYNNNSNTKPGYDPNATSFSSVFGDAGKGGSAASGLLSVIAREQWADYKQRFQPIENQLLGVAKNPSQYVQNQQQQALGAVDQSFAQAPGNIARQESSFGLSLNPEQQQNINARIGTSKSLAEVGALNNAGRTANDQILGLMGGGMFSGNQQAINQTLQLGAVKAS